MPTNNRISHFPLVSYHKEWKENFSYFTSCAEMSGETGGLSNFKCLLVCVGESLPFAGDSHWLGCCPVFLTTPYQPKNQEVELTVSIPSS